MGEGGHKGAAGVDRATIAREVIAKLAAAVHLDTGSIRENSELAFDLGLGAAGRRAMAADYNAIIDAHHGEPVTLDDAGDLETVKDAVDLVFHHCGGHGGGAADGGGDR